MAKVYSSQLAKEWGVRVQHALYRETGDWYHQLERFPGALFDAHGYVIFESRKAFETCPYLQIRQDVNVKPSINRMPGYVQVVVKGRQLDLKRIRRTTYEAETRREGAAFDIVLTRYERDPATRAACLRYYGYACSVCDITFERVYGDLRPVCPNCHAMLHRKAPPLSISELRKLLRSE